MTDTIDPNSADTEKHKDNLCKEAFVAALQNFEGFKIILCWLLDAENGEIAPDDPRVKAFSPPAIASSREPGGYRGYRGYRRECGRIWEQFIDVDQSDGPLPLATYQELAESAYKLIGEPGRAMALANCLSLHTLYVALQEAGVIASSAALADAEKHCCRSGSVYDFGSRPNPIKYLSPDELERQVNSSSYTGPPITSSDRLPSIRARGPGKAGPTY